MLLQPSKFILCLSAICGLFLLATLAAAHPADPLPKGAIARFGSPQFRHGGWITSIEFLGNGRVVASAATDGHVRFWDFLTGKQIRKHDFGNNAFIALSPDRKRLAVSVNSDKSVQIWDVNRWKMMRRLPMASGRSRGSALVTVWSPDGKQIAGGVFLNLWDVESGRGRILRKGVFEILEPIKQLAYALGGKTLIAMGDESGEIVALDPMTGKLQWHTESHVRQFAISPCGNILARQDARFAIRLLDLRDGQKETRVFHFAKTASSMTFSPDGRFLAAGDVDGMIHLWSLRTGKKVRTMSASEYITALAFSPNGRILAAGGSEGVVRFWEIVTGSEIHPRATHNGTISSIAVASDGKSLVSGSRDGTICIWDAAGGRSPLRIQAHRKPVWCVAVAPIGRLIASAGDDAVIRIWDRESGRMLRELPGHKWNGKVAFSPNGKLVAGAFLDGDGYARVGFWDTKNWQLKLKIGRYSSSISCLAFSRDGTMAAVASYSNPSFAIWDVTTGATAGKRIAKLPHATVIGAAFTRDGKSLIANSRSRGTVEQIDLASGNNVHRFVGPKSKGYSTHVIALSPNGKLLAGGDGADVVLWNVDSGQEIRRFLGHFGLIMAIAWSPDGQSLYSGGVDGGILEWDLTARRRVMPAKTIPLRWNGDKVWENLVSRDAAVAYHGIAAIVANPMESVVFLRKRLPKSNSTDPKVIERLVKQLNSKRFLIREKAMSELIRLGPHVAPRLKKVLANSPSLEMRRRVLRILATFDSLAIPAAILQKLRAIEALGYAATVDARSLLTTIAESDDDTRISAAAKKALGRIMSEPAPNR